MNEAQQWNAVERFWRAPPVDVSLASISTEGFFSSEQAPAWQKQAVFCNCR
jgi:hypothetical protein